MKKYPPCKEISDAVFFYHYEIDSGAIKFRFELAGGHWQQLPFWTDCTLVRCLFISNVQEPALVDMEQPYKFCSRDNFMLTLLSLRQCRNDP